MTRIEPCLWLDGVAEEAANFYVSLLPDSRIDSVLRGPIETPSARAGAVLAVNFTLGGNRFMALNGGAHYKPTPAISFFIHCADQAEVDHLWGALLADGGAPMACGWLTDRFGIAWQIVPERMNAMLADPDPAKVRRAFTAMTGMIKLDVAALERAFEGEEG
jgi:predicted 3-demethylubiquinone-9 3-methyltransferase (glyoxalase superfamily)